MGACISLKENSILDLVWHIIRCIIESLQLLSVFVQVTFKWPEAVHTLFSWTGYFRIDVSGAVFLAFFLLVFILFGTYVVILMVLLICGEEWCAGLEDTLAEVIWYLIGDSILWGILFVPCATLSLEMFNCTRHENNGNLYVTKYKSMQCWTAAHIVLCILSVIILIIIIAGIREKAKQHDMDQHDTTKKSKVRCDVHNIDSRFAIVRFICLILGINIAQISSLAASILMFFLFVYPLYYNIWYIPFVNMNYNYAYVAMHAFNVWAALSVVITVLTPYKWIGFVIWCIFPVGIGVACFLCNKRLVSRPLTPSDLRVDFDRSSLNVAIECDNPYLNYVQYRTVSALLKGKEDQCLSFRPINIDMLIYELLTDDAKVKQLELQREQKKNKKDKERTTVVDAEQQNIREIYEFRTDWLCIHASNQTELSKRENLTDNELDGLCGCIVGCNELVVLRLNGWNLKGESLRKFVDIALVDSMNVECRHHNLRVIDFADNQMIAEDATYILDKVYGMQQNCEDMMQLEEICLANNYVGDSKGSDLQREHALGKILVV